MKGLYNKYTVVKNDTGSTICNCFVLRPDRDLHARIALQAYAASCQKENPTLAVDILFWLDKISLESKND